MAKKENFQEYVARTQNEIAGIEQKIEAEELKKLQLEHKMQRLQNVTEYKVNKSKKTRVSRLITRGAAIECICKDVELLDKAEFFLLAERIFSDQDLRDEITKMVVGRRDRIEAGEAELQSTIEDLKEAGYWKSSRKEQEMASYHFHLTQVKRSRGQSVIAQAAYRAGEKLYSTYYGESSDFTRKRGVVMAEICLPDHAPREYADRETLWNALEWAESGRKAQLAHSFDITLMNEFSMEENIEMVRAFVQEELVSRGMIADFAIHDPVRPKGAEPNPHIHILVPIRPLKEDGTWGIKERKEDSGDG